MALPGTILTGIGLTLVLGVASVLLFFQTKDPAVLVLLGMPIGATWLIVLVVHVLIHGFPVRVIQEKK